MTKRPLHVVFVHLDLGIGGAEQLVLQLAQASVDLGHRIEIVTSRCDASHCFAPVKPGGSLHPYLHVWGRWIPRTIFGKAKAILSTVRLLYISYKLVRSTSPDLIVLDVLPTPLPLLKLSDSSLLFYCHFPDQLLCRSRWSNVLVRAYRRLMDLIEAHSMRTADVCAVNSQFTQKVVQETFHYLSKSMLPVLYPALDTSAVDSDLLTSKKKYQIVSLNRYERKKNLELLLYACQYLKRETPEFPEIIIAGGYDAQHAENVEYRSELEALAQDLSLQVTFMSSVSDGQRTQLLRESLVLVYTPSEEHFGIVPLEAMASGTCVLAVASGGPLETVKDGRTGMLRSATPEAFGKALGELLDAQGALAARMGTKGPAHVQQHFGSDRLGKEWNKLTQRAVFIGEERRRKHPYRPRRSALYAAEALAASLVCFGLLWVLHRIAAYLDVVKTI